MTSFFPQCANCKHFHRYNKAADTCDAFPSGIPRLILSNRMDHRYQVKGDSDIRYSPIDLEIQHPKASFV